MSSFIIPIRDNDGSLGRSSFPVDPTSADIDLTALYTAVDALNTGTMGTATLVQELNKDAGSDENSPDPQARKSRAFRVYYQGVTNTKLRGTVTIACADATLVPGVEELDISAGVGLALKNAFEAVGQHRATAEAIVVTKITFLN